MENLNECAWKKYEEKLVELENRLAGRKHAAGAQQQALAASAMKIPAAQPEPGTGFSRAEAKLEAVIAENNRLKEETKFLKQENETSIDLKEEISRLKYEFERASRETDAEISRLYARNKRLADEAARLALDNRRITLRNAGTRQSASTIPSRHVVRAAPVLEKAIAGKIINENRERPGILQWLSKPLIVVKAG